MARTRSWGSLRPEPGIWLCMQLECRVSIVCACAESLPLSDTHLNTHACSSRKVSGLTPTPNQHAHLHTDTLAAFRQQQCDAMHALCSHGCSVLRGDCNGRQLPRREMTRPSGRRGPRQRPLSCGASCRSSGTSSRRWTQTPGNVWSGECGEVAEVAYVRYLGLCVC
jgi:hypothetical protein